MVPEVRIIGRNNVSLQLIITSILDIAMVRVL